MLIKSADDRTTDLEALRQLAARPDATAESRKRIEQEIRNVQSGIRGEEQAAYEIEFHYGNSSNWMSIHDLRLECEGRIAQIDHLLINRFLEIYVCESKSFAEGVAINEAGEFSAFYGNRPYGIPSPLEQNRKHIAVLQSLFKTERVPLPRRLGFQLTPTLIGLVLVSKTARITRPKTKIDGLDSILKNDQLKARINRDIDADNNVLHMAKLIGQDTLRDFAERIAEEHRPIKTNWAAKFGLPLVPPTTLALAPSRTSAPPRREPPQAPDPVVAGSTDAPKSKLICVSCAAPVSYAVAKFCWVNKPRFAGNVYCMECQKVVAKPT